MSQWELVLAYIKAHGSITALDAIMELGIIDLAGRIRDLRHRGYPIVSTPEAGKNRWGDKVRYVRYTIHGQAMERPELLGFPVICAGRRVKIPKAAFVRFMKGETA